MENLITVFDIPDYYHDLIEEIHSENLLDLLKADPIDFMRDLYRKDSKLFYNVRDELILRGIGFKTHFQNNYLLAKNYDIKHVLYKKENTYAFKKINFTNFGVVNFIERFNVKSDLFFKNMPWEGLLNFMQGDSFTLLKESFLNAGFSIVPVEGYHATPIVIKETAYNNTNTTSIVKDKSFLFERKIEKVMFTLDTSIGQIFEDSQFDSFRKYCKKNGIFKFSDLSIDTIENFAHEKYVQEKTMLRVKRQYHKINRKINPLPYLFNEAYNLMHDNAFKDLFTLANKDYLEFINEFYTKDDGNIYQEHYPFEIAENFCEFVRENKEYFEQEANQRKYDDLFRSVQNHPKYKFVLSSTLYELVNAFSLFVNDDLNLDVYLYEVENDIRYGEILKEILISMDSMLDLQGVFEKISLDLNSREKDTLRYRKNMTLQEVGEIIGVTRERVRQLERKARLKICKYKDKLNLEIYFRYCLEHLKIVNAEDIKSLLSIENELEGIYLEELMENEENVKYVDSIQCYILKDTYDLIKNSMEKLNLKVPIIEINDLKETLSEEIISKSFDFLDLIIQSQGYKRVKMIYVKEKISNQDCIDYLFRKVINAPIKMDDEGFKLFKRYMKETFDIQFDANKRATGAQIARSKNVILVDRSTYFRHEEKMITTKFLSEIQGIFDKILESYDYADPRLIYQDYPLLMNSASIRSPEHLYSIIQLYFEDRYLTGHHNTLYVYKANSNLQESDEILLNYLRNNGHEVPREKVLEDLKWKDLKLDQLIPRMETVIIVGNKMVKTIESFHFTEEELTELKRIIDQEIEKGYMFIEDLSFELAFNEKLEALIERGNLTDSLTLTSITKWLYQEIRGHSKLLYKPTSHVKKIEQAVEEKFPEIVSRGEISEFIKEKGYGDQTDYYLPFTLVNEHLFYNYTTTKFINAKIINFNDEVKKSLKKYLDEQFKEKVYRSVFFMNGFSQKILPISSFYDWTEWLICQFAEQLGYRKIQSSNSDYRYDKLILVKEDSEIYSYDQLVYYIIKTEYKGRYHEEDLAQYLVSQNLAFNPRTLNYEIYNSPLFKFDTFRFFELRGESIDVE